jgi:hypothetical protein
MGISFTYAPLGGKCPNFTSFKSFQDYDPWGTGVLRPDAIPTAMSVAAELIDARLNPER